MIIKKRPLFNLNTAFENVPKEWLNHIEPRVTRGPFLPCWVWHGSIDDNGYPRMRIDDNKVVKVHRWVAGLFWDFPDDYYVKQTCGCRNCVNPTHLKVTLNNPRWE